MHPPSFYDEDLMKYKVKFQKAIAMRRDYKKQIAKVFQSVEGPGEIVVKEKIRAALRTKRLPSRQSNTHNTTIDFDYRGNSRDIVHLLKPRESGSPNAAQVRFELGLRTYMASSLSRDENNETTYKKDNKPPWRVVASNKPLDLSTSESL